MPIFDYECHQCGKIFERLVIRDMDTEMGKCPHCEGLGTRVIAGTNVSFRLYGEGFYKRSHKDTGDFAD